MTTPTKPLKKGFKFPIYPTLAQKELLEKTFGCCRYVYNRALAEAKAEYKHYLAMKQAPCTPEPTKPDVSGYGFVARLPGYKSDPESTWLSEVSAVALQQSMLHLGEAFKRFLHTRRGYPSFKKKTSQQSFNLMKTAFDIRDGQLFIAKSQEPVKVVYSRPLPSDPSSLTISKNPSGQYFVSFTCEYNPPKTSGTGRIGIDLGIKDLLTLSTGERIANPRHYVRAQQKLRRLQQSHSRKHQGSRNSHKSRLALAAQHARIANCRHDFQHQLSRRLVNENQVIGLESLGVKNMARNRHLAKHVMDAAWSGITQKLNYKTIESQHCTLVYMDVWYPSSHLCSVTGLRLDRKLKLSERSWPCPHCGQTHDRDLNAANNILQEAERVLSHLPPEDSAGRILLARAS